MTAAQVKAFFRTLLKVVPGGPALGTPGSARVQAVLLSLDKIVDFVGGLGGAPAWVAGPQQEGALVYYSGATYRVQKDLDSAQPPGGSNTNYLLLGPGGGTSYSDAQARAAQLGRTAPAGTTSVTLTAESPTDYGTASNGATFSVSATGCQVGQCAFFNVAANGGPPSFVNDSPVQPYDLTLGTHVPGQLNRYAVRVFADRVEVTNVVR